MAEGFLYEPRSLWSTANVDLTGVTIPTRVRMEKRHFYNGERWPIELRRIALMAVNPTLMASTATPADPPAEERGVALNLVEVGISVPQRYHLNPKRFLNAASLAPNPTWMPFPGFLGGAVRRSSRWGQSMLKFDKPLVLPREGSIEWDISAMTAGPSTQQLPAVPAICARVYQEEGGLFAGSGRFHAHIIPIIAPAIAAGYPLNPDERWPYQPDSFSGADVVAPLISDWWAPAGRFSVRQFDQQESTRSGSTKLTDMRVFIDQRAYDARSLAVFPTAQPAPLSMRVGTRVKITNGGSNTWWWRPGAPLGLVFDHISPANVYDLIEPVTLRPGEQIDVELVFPPPIDPENPPTYHIGVALNGYAAIEG